MVSSFGDVNLSLHFPASLYALSTMHLHNLSNMMRRSLTYRTNVRPYSTNKSAFPAPNDAERVARVSKSATIPEIHNLPEVRHFQFTCPSVHLCET